MSKLVNRGFKLASERLGQLKMKRLIDSGEVGDQMNTRMLGREEVCELLDIKEVTYFKMLRGEINLKLDYAAKLCDASGVAWGKFKEFE